MQSAILAAWLETLGAVAGVCGVALLLVYVARVALKGER